MSYIAYLDLLGTKNFCEEGDSYYTNITRFTNDIKTLAPILKSGKLGIFSDCVYIECKHIETLLRFLTKLRIMLMAENLFFNAAISKGSLGVKKIDSNTTENDKENTFGVEFLSKEIVSIYCKQNDFRGIGIWVDDSIIDPIKQCQKYNVIKSLYFAKKENNGTTNYKAIEYFDIPLFNLEADSNDSYYEKRKKDILSIILQNMYKAHCQSQKFSSYYISLFVNIIRCCDTQKLKWNQINKEFENTSIEFDIIYKFLIECDKQSIDLIGMDYLCLALLDCIYNANSIVDFDKAEITKDFIDKFKCLKNNYQYSLEKVPSEPFTKNNIKKFKLFCNDGNVNKFIDNIIS